MTIISLVVVALILGQMPTRFEVPKEGRKILSGCFIEIDDATGAAKKIENIVINDDRPFGSSF